MTLITFGTWMVSNRFEQVSNPKGASASRTGRALASTGCFGCVPSWYERVGEGATAC